ncbi:hypothetical protein BC567DRAFT_216815 [Phyllosticta citribraziliensis]
MSTTLLHQQVNRPRAGSTMSLFYFVSSLSLPTISQESKKARQSHPSRDETTQKGRPAHSANHSARQSVSQSVNQTSHAYVRASERQRTHACLARLPTVRRRRDGRLVSSRPVFSAKDRQADSRRQAGTQWTMRFVPRQPSNASATAAASTNVFLRQDRQTARQLDHHRAPDSPTDRQTQHPRSNKERKERSNARRAYNNGV